MGEPAEPQAPTHPIEEPEAPEAPTHPITPPPEAPTHPIEEPETPEEPTHPISPPAEPAPTPHQDAGTVEPKLSLEEFCLTQSLKPMHEAALRRWMQRHRTPRHADLATWRGYWQELLAHTPT